MDVCGCNMQAEEKSIPSLITFLPQEEVAPKLPPKLKLNKSYLSHLLVLPFFYPLKVYI